MCRTGWPAMGNPGHGEQANACAKCDVSITRPPARRGVEAQSTQGAQHPGRREPFESGMSGAGLPVERHARHGVLFHFDG